jgi:hypothetical protein
MMGRRRRLGGNLKLICLLLVKFHSEGMQSIKKGGERNKKPFKVGTHTHTYTFLKLLFESSLIKYLAVCLTASNGTVKAKLK